MREIFRDILGYEGVYQISNLLNVKSLDKKVQCKNQATRISKGVNRKVYIDNNGYLAFTVYSKNKSSKLYIHRVIWEAFVNKIPQGMVINHKDGNKLNNDLNNLEVITQADNLKHSINVLGNHTRGIKHPSCVLTERLVLQIKEYSKQNKKSTEISKIMKLNRSTVLAVCNGSSWKSI